MRSYHVELSARFMADMIAKATCAGLATVVEQQDGMQVSCLNCMHFAEPQEQCMKFGGRPPARVIAFGCNEHLDTGEIPW